MSDGANSSGSSIDKMARAAYEAWLATSVRLGAYCYPATRLAWDELNDLEKAAWIDAALAAAEEARRQLEATTA